MWCLGKRAPSASQNHLGSAGEPAGCPWLGYGRPQRAAHSLCSLAGDCRRLCLRQSTLNSEAVAKAEGRRETPAEPGAWVREGSSTPFPTTILVPLICSPRSGSRHRATQVRDKVGNLELPPWCHPSRNCRSAEGDTNKPSSSALSLATAKPAST